MDFVISVHQSEDSPHLYDVFVNGVRRARVAEHAVVKHVTQYTEEVFA